MTAMKAMIKGLWGNALYRNSSIFFVGNIVAGLGGYAYQVAMGRMLSVSEYGTLISLVNLFALLSMPAGALATAAIHQTAVLKGQGRYGVIRYFFRKLTVWFSLVGVVLFAILAAISPWMREFLHLPSLGPYLIFCTTLGGVFLISLWRGILSGLQQFVTVSWISTLESVVKFLAAVVLVVLVHGVAGATVAIVVSMACSAFLFYRALRLLKAYPEERAAWSELPNNFFFIIVWTFAITALSSIDILMVKRYFSAEETGLYAALSLIGKIIFFASSAISSVLFPMATELYESGNHRHHRALLWKALSLTLGISGIAVLMYALMPRFIIHVLFGGRYDAFASELYLFGALAGLLAVIQLLATYLLSIQKKLFIVALGGAPIVELILLRYVHGSIRGLLIVCVAVVGTLAAILFASFLRDQLPKERVVPQLPPGGQV